MTNISEVVRNAWKAGLVVPAFNVAHLPMVEPLVKAVVDTDSFAMLAVSRIDWMKFEAKGVREVSEDTFREGVAAE